MSIARPEGGWNISRTPVHPGEMLREEFMKPLGISINGLALELHVPVTRISEIVNERRGITADTALRLARHFGTSPDFWMNIQKDYELILTRQKSLKYHREAGPAAHGRGVRNRSAWLTCFRPFSADRFSAIFGRFSKLAPLLGY